MHKQQTIITRTPMNTTQQFYYDCGEIMLLSTSIDYELGKHLTMILKHNNPPDIFTNILDEYSNKGFYEKIILLEKLCDEKKTDKERKKRLLKALNEIRESRNKVGHWGASYNPKNDEFRLQGRKPKEQNKEYFDAHKAAKEVSQNWFIAHRELIELYNEIFFPKTSINTTEKI
jgi:hypothetical protein